MPLLILSGLVGALGAASTTGWIGAGWMEIGLAYGLGGICGLGLGAGGLALRAVGPKRSSRYGVKHPLQAR
jgi:hypothetical protein